MQILIRFIDACRGRCSEDGQDLLEYALLVALIALVAAGAITTVGETINTVFWTFIVDGLASAGA